MLLVQKFGGTSMADVGCIEHVADKIALNAQKGHQLIAVVSAMSGETNRLVQLATSLYPGNRNNPDYALLLASGEMVSISLLSLALQKRGLQAQAFTGAQAGIMTDDSFHKARITNIEADHILTVARQGIVPVVAGFQGMNARGQVTTLGRGGSDTTAVALAAYLQADECQIYTDVEGVYTTDPRVEPKAQRLEKITFEEMLELASLGAKVLQIRSVEFAGKYNVPLRVLSTFVEGPGTLITYEDDLMEQPVVSGIAFNRNEAKITIIGVPDKPGIASDILSPISAANIPVDMIIQNLGLDGNTDFTFTVHREDFNQAMEILLEVAKKIHAREVKGDDCIAKLSIVGVGMRSHTGIATKIFTALAQAKINIKLIATSEIKVSVVVDEKDLEHGVKTLHQAFGLDHQATEEFDPS